MQRECSLKRGFEDEDTFYHLEKNCPLRTVIALLLSFSACGKGDPVTEFKIRNDRVSTEVSFNLPGSEAD